MFWTKEDIEICYQVAKIVEEVTGEVIKVEDESMMSANKKILKALIILKEFKERV